MLACLIGSLFIHQLTYYEVYCNSYLDGNFEAKLISVKSCWTFTGSIELGMD